MANTQHFEEFLEKQLERVNEWLTFAEAKNAALIAFNIAAITLIADFRENYPVLSTIIMLIFIASTVYTLLSFVPQTPSRPDPKIVEDETWVPNLVFWMDIANTKNENHYLQLVKDHYFPDDPAAPDSALCIDLACEIVINSRIAARKYQFFNRALKIDLAAFFVTVILLIVA